MKRILIVDDAIDLGRLLQDALRVTHADLPVTVVPSAEEALLEATTLAFDLLVTDLRLPGMNGLELIRKIRVRQPNIKVILMTALMPEDRLVRQKDQVAPDIFLRKPITAAAFLEAVDSLVGTAPRTEAALQAAKPEVDLAGVLPGEPAAQAVPADPRPTPVEEPSQPESLSAILSNLRSGLGAQTVLLLDERGRAVAQAGDLPEFSSDWALIAPLMSAVSTSAKISHLLGQPVTQSVQAFRGKEIDLVLSPVGQFGLLAALKPGRSVLRLAIVFEEILSARSETAAALDAMGLHVMTSLEAGAPEQLFADRGANPPGEPVVPIQEKDTPLVHDPTLEKFEDLFAKKQTGELHLLDADAFWETASDEVGPLEIPGVLSFDQAQKLGLFPPEETEG